MFGGYGIYMYCKSIVRHNQKYARKHGSLRGSGLGTGLLIGLLNYFI